MRNKSVDILENSNPRIRIFYVLFALAFLILAIVLG